MPGSGLWNLEGGELSPLTEETQVAEGEDRGGQGHEAHAGGLGPRGIEELEEGGAADEEGEGGPGRRQPRPVVGQLGPIQSELIPQRQKHLPLGHQ